MAHDTGLASRHSLIPELDQAVASPARGGDPPGCLC